MATTKTKKDNQLAAKSKFSFENLSTEGRVDASKFSEDSIPYMQILNPKDKDLDGKFGLGIKKEIAEQVGFTPDENWSLINYHFSAGSSATQMYVSKTPRLVVLEKTQKRLFKDDKNMCTKYAKDVVYDSIPQEDKKYTKWVDYYLVALLSEENDFLTNSPLRLVASNTSGTRFKNAFGEFIKHHHQASVALGICSSSHTLNAHKPFIGLMVFQPQIGIDVSGKEGYQSTVCSYDQFTKLDTHDHFENFTLEPNGAVDAQLKCWAEDHADWVDSDKLVTQPKPQQATVDDRSSDNIIDAIAADIMPNGNNGGGYQAVVDSNIPF